MIIFFAIVLTAVAKEVNNCWLARQKESHEASQIYTSCMYLVNILRSLCVQLMHFKMQNNVSLLFVTCYDMEYFEMKFSDVHG